MNKAPAFQFYWQDFDHGTSRFTCEQVGAYLRLLIYSWDKNTLPNDVEKLADIAATTHETIEKILPKFCEKPDGTLFNKKLESVRAAQFLYRESRIKNAKTKKTKKHPKAYAKHSEAYAEHTEMSRDENEYENIFFKTKELEEAWEKFKNFRREKNRAFTKTSAETFIAKILSDCDGNETEAANRLTTAIAADWLNAYPEKKDKPKTAFEAAQNY